MNSDCNRPEPSSLPHNGTPTSRAAAASMADHAPTIRAELYGLIVASGSTGLTADELSALTGRPSQTVGPRVLDLRRADLIANTGRTRPTRSGRAAVVYAARGHVATSAFPTPSAP